MRKILALMLALAMMLICCTVSFAEAEEPMVISFMLTEHVHSVMNNEVYTFKTLGEMFNVTFDFQMVASDVYNEKVNMVLASGEYPDVMACSTDLMSQYYDTGVVLELTDLIPEKIPNFLTACEAANDNYLKNIKDDDGRYWFLTTIEYSNYTLFPFLNEAWLKEVGKEVPTTMDELFDVLMAFKELKGDDAVIWCSGPWTGSNIWSTAIQYFGTSNRWMHEEEGSYVFGPYERADNLKEALTFMHKCSEAGLLDPDWMTRDDDAINALINSNQVGFFITYGDNGNTWGPGGTNGVDFIMPGPMSGGGHKPYVQPNTMISHNFYIMSTVQGEKLDKLCEIMNYIYSDEGAKLFSFGEEGVTYTLDEAGEPVFTDVILQHELGGVNGRRQLGINPNPFPHVSLDTAWGQLVGEVSNGCLEAHRKYWALPAPVLAPTVDEASEQAQLYADIKKYVDTACAKFITGDLSLETDWDTYIKTLEDMGVQRYIEIVGGEYQRWLQR